MSCGTAWRPLSYRRTDEITFPDITQRVHPGTDEKLRLDVIERTCALNLYSLTQLIVPSSADDMGKGSVRSSRRARSLMRMNTAERRQAEQKMHQGTSRRPSSRERSDESTKKRPDLKNFTCGLHMRPQPPEGYDEITFPDTLLRVYTPRVYSGSDEKMRFDIVERVRALNLCNVFEEREKIEEATQRQHDYVTSTMSDNFETQLDKINGQIDSVAPPSPSPSSKQRAWKRGLTFGDDDATLLTTPSTAPSTTPPCSTLSSTQSSTLSAKQTAQKCYFFSSRSSRRRLFEEGAEGPSKTMSDNEAEEVTRAQLLPAQ